jgi:hypothetical protein
MLKEHTLAMKYLIILSQTTERLGRVVNTPSYSEVPGFKSRSGHRLSLLRFFVFFSESLQVNVRIIPQIKPWELPFTPFPINRYVVWVIEKVSLIFYKLINNTFSVLKLYEYMRFQVLTAASMKFRIVFWDVLPCKKIVGRRFRGTCCLHHQGWIYSLHLWKLPQNNWLCFKLYAPLFISVLED